MYSTCTRSPSSALASGALLRIMATHNSNTANNRCRPALKKPENQRSLRWSRGGGSSPPCQNISAMACHNGINAGTVPRAGAARAPISARTSWSLNWLPPRDARVRSQLLQLYGMPVRRSCRMLACRRQASRLINSATDVTGMRRSTQPALPRGM
jgi:hypothetical protein